MEWARCVSSHGAPGFREDVWLAEGAYVFAEFGEGVEGAAPGDASVAEGGEHGAEERVEE